jgi:hypothetical protein
MRKAASARAHPVLTKKEPMQLHAVTIARRRIVKAGDRLMPTKESNGLLIAACDQSALRAIALILDASTAPSTSSIIAYAVIVLIICAILFAMLIFGGMTRGMPSKGNKHSPSDHPRICHLGICPDLLGIGAVP